MLNYFKEVNKKKGKLSLKDKYENLLVKVYGNNFLYIKYKYRNYFTRDVFEDERIYEFEDEINSIEIDGMYNRINSGGSNEDYIIYINGIKFEVNISNGKIVGLFKKGI